jgi:lysophospholipase L1-like esterase
MRLRSRRLLVAVALLPVLGACSSDRTAEGSGSPNGTTGTTPPSTAPPVRSMVMVGDSITNGSEVELREQLAALDVEIESIDAEDGRRILHDGFVDSGLQAVTALAARAPDLWVIALGTNDVGQYEEADYASVIEELLDAVPADAPVVWVDVYVESSPEASAQFNAALRDQLAERGAAAVVAWGSLADDDGVLRDGIHPSGYGIEQFAEMVTSAVAHYATPRG